ncbi:HTH_Tnp_Tc3_2 domain-containing protein [Trichonephila clavipes]|nr:HTH_Tnp_Tc3_2 domain-containing protein [Trichonephila clavipes]
MAHWKHLDDFYVVEFLDDWNVDEPSWKYPEELGIIQSVISGRQRFQDDGNVSRCYSAGRSRVTTPNENRYLAVTAKRSRRITASDLSRQFSSANGTTVSRQTE